MSKPSKNIECLLEASKVCFFNLELTKMFTRITVRSVLTNSDNLGFVIIFKHSWPESKA